MPKNTKKAARRRKTQGIEGTDLDASTKEIDVLSDTYTILSEDLSDPFNDEAEEEEEYETLDDDNPNAVCAREAKLVDCLSLASTLSSEKRAAKREQGLRTLFKGITQYATGKTGQELIESRLDEVILPICTQGLTGKASPAEQYASCRVLEATAIVLGHDQDDFVQSILQKLSILVKVIQRAVQVRGAALRALSMACFVCSSGGDATDAVLNLCEQVSAPVFREEPNPDSLRAVALDCWALLSTTIEDVYLAGNEVPGIGDGRGLVILPLLSKCLDSNNLDLRCAAGECVALIHEARLDLGIDEDEGENLSERRYRRGSWDGSEWEVLMDEVKQRVAELSVESGKHMSKKAKKDQRATFREFMATIVDDEAPEEIVAFRGGQLTLSTWKEIIQLNFVRHCLQSGFQHQLMTNETLQMIFGANGEILNVNASLSQLEKRHFMSKSGEAAKKAYKERNKSRKAKIGAKDSFLYADD